MKYQVIASSKAKDDAIIQIKQSQIDFGTTAKSADSLPNPAELFLGAFSACMLKNVERFSDILKFSYSKATVEVNATRLANPPRIDNINYKLTISGSNEKLNKALLKRNIEKFGTIYNTMKMSCTITGTINTIEHV